MQNRIISILLPLNIILICLVFLLLYLTQWNVDLQQKITQTLSSLNEQEKRANFVLLQTYFAYSDNFDELSAGKRDIDKKLERIQQNISNIRNPIIAAKMKKLLSDYQKIHQSRSDSIDDFMSSYSTLKNSVSYLPVLMGELLAKSTQLSISEKEYLNASKLALLESTASKKMYELPIKPDGFDIEKAEKSFLLLEKHNNIIFENLPRVYSLVNQIVKSSGSEKIYQAEQLQNTYINRLSGYQNRLMNSLYCLSVILLVILIFICYLLYKSKKLVDNANSRLEVKVRERTSDLEEARDEALHLAKVKSEFVAKMSHELRTPMNGIIGFADLLSERIKKEENKSDLNTIKESAKSLLSIINDILDFSRIESGNFPIVNENFSMDELIDGVYNFFRSSESENVKWNVEKWDIDLGIKNGFNGDLNRIRQILMNVIGNAFKFTETGEVKLTAKLEDITEEDASIKLQVSDTGTGIKKDRLSAIFRSFTQEDDTTTRNYGGTGLGLTISHALAELMGGSLTVESTVGEGSTFTLTLKLERTVFRKEKSRVEINTIKWSKQPQILIVEDNRVNQKVISKLLEKQDCYFVIADNGREALVKLEESHFDLVLMDCQMPVMDGYEATRKIRSFQNDLSRVPIIALSANALEEDVQHCLDCGMNSFLSKPVEVKKVIEALSKYLQHLIEPLDKSA